MQPHSTLRPREKPERNIHFEIGDKVCLRANPEWTGIVVARTISENVNVLWDNHGIERIDGRLLQLAVKKS